MTSKPSLKTDVRQKFISPDGQDLASLLSYPCELFNVRYVLWDEVRSTFPGLQCLRNKFMRVYFMVDKKEEVIVPLRIQYTGIHPYEVFAGRSRRGHSLSDNKMLDPGHQKSNALARSDGDPLLHLQRYQHIEEHILAKAYSPLDYAAPKLFLILPDNLVSWVDTDTRTHVFRL
ncbi:hypothetical protein BGZ74_007870 [Mortierella antarctica]|nr:hypothetical protein BGZ74_007870 [Mortierella antarctica]